VIFLYSKTGSPKKSQSGPIPNPIDFEIEVLTFVCLKSRFLYETTLHILTTILEECSSTPREKTVDRVQL
tara:strand:- start:1172 stop:1381 length:210 start_codon:yes stop_codon:yes gene_type:complete